MNILISNDDGYQAEGLAILARVAAEFANVRVVAPERNRSGASNSLTLDKPLRVRQAENGFYFVNGTPTDCIHTGLHVLPDFKPDWVFSGINHGANMGDDTLYSGTVAAATEALKAHPKINATIDDKQVTYHDVEHIGIAVDTPRGLLVPVVKNAGELNIPGLARRINDLAARTRENRVNPDELSGSTFTITNTGSGGALFDTPIINQPEVAILGLGAIQKQPRVIKDVDGDEAIAIRSVCHLALSYDHRLVDGADAARYLMTVKRRLEEGDFTGELGL